MSTCPYIFTKGARKGETCGTRIRTKGATFCYACSRKKPNRDTPPSEKTLVQGDVPQSFLSKFSTNRYWDQEPRRKRPQLLEDSEVPETPKEDHIPGYDDEEPVTIPEPLPPVRHRIRDDSPNLPPILPNVTPYLPSIPPPILPNIPPCPVERSSGAYVVATDANGFLLFCAGDKPRVLGVIRGGDLHSLDADETIRAARSGYAL